MNRIAAPKPTSSSALTHRDHKTNRPRNDLSGLSLTSAANAITHSTHRLNQFDGMILINFAAQVMDIHLDQLCAGVAKSAFQTCSII